MVHRGFNRWIDNTTVSYTDWDDQSDLGTYQCAALREDDGQWIGDDCTDDTKHTFCVTETSKFSIHHFGGKVS